MNVAIIGFALSMASVVAGFFAAPKHRDYALPNIIGGWVALTACAFFIRDNLFCFMAMSLVLAFLSPQDPVKRICFYVGVMALSPLSYTAAVPFPGLNYLIILNYAKVVTLIVLGPLFIMRAAAPAPPSLRSVDNLIFMFVLLASIISFRELPFTSVLRLFVDMMILYVLPYIAISRTIKSAEDINSVFKAFFASMVVIAVIGIFSVARSWNYYAQLYDLAGIKVYAEYRNGLLRVYSTMNTTMLALTMGAAAVVTMRLRQLKIVPALYAYGALGLFGFIAFATGSRGGWLAAIAVVGSYFVFRYAAPFLRSFYVYAAFAAAFGFGAAVTMNSSMLSGQSANIAYRAELLRTSVEQIASRPLFGENGFRDSPRFAHLRQGEGIVDIVNTYVEVAMNNGLVGAFLLFGGLGAAFFGGLNRMNRMRRSGAETPGASAGEHNLIIIVAIMIGFFAMIATTSAVSLTWHFGILCTALAVAQSRVFDQAVSASATKSAPEPAPLIASADETEISEPDVKRPYGARFVRDK
ncbi:MAG: O-antigen ligase family protein [Pseudomonadota bacterium]